MYRFKLSVQVKCKTDLDQVTHVSALTLDCKFPKVLFFRDYLVPLINLHP